MPKLKVAQDVPEGSHVGYALRVVGHTLLVSIAGLAILKESISLSFSLLNTSWGLALESKLLPMFSSVHFIAAQFLSIQRKLFLRLFRLAQVH